MFLTCDQNRLPTGPEFGDDMALWGVAELFGGAEMLIVQFAASKRACPRIAMVALSAGAGATLMQLDADGQKVLGAAVLSARPHKDSTQWRLEPLSEIHVGATKTFNGRHPLMSFARFTTFAGESFSLPIGFAEKSSHGRCVFRSEPVSAPKVTRRLSTDNVASAT
jgi:hypothetical protein